MTNQFGVLLLQTIAYVAIMFRKRGNQAMKMKKTSSIILVIIFLLCSTGGTLYAANSPKTISVDIWRNGDSFVNYNEIISFEVTNVLESADYTLDYVKDNTDVKGNSFVSGGKIIAQAPCVLTYNGIKKSVSEGYELDMYIQKLDISQDKFNEFANSGSTEANQVTGELIWDYTNFEERIEIKDSVTLEEGFYFLGYDQWGCTFLGYIQVGKGGSAIPNDKPSAWAADFVKRANDLKLVPNELNSKYTQPITRAEYCALAAVLYEKLKGEITERKTFTDTVDVNVQKMGALKVVNGVGNDRFNPDSKLNREQSAVVLANLANALGKPLDKKPASFADKDIISSWALESVGQVQGASVMGGVGNNTFNPGGDYTREQSIITMLRLYDLMQ
jgi:hypothetical protein